MKLLGVFIACSALAVGAAQADTIEAFTESGAPTKIDTANLKGCQLIFDSAGTPFELCKMEKVEFRPQQSTRARPGVAAREEVYQVVYRKAAN